MARGPPTAPGAGWPHPRRGAALAAEGPDQVDDLPPSIVHYIHLEWPARAAALPRATVVILLGEEDVLPHAVHDLVLVRGLPASKSLQQLHLLLDEEMVDHSQVLQAWRSQVPWHPRSLHRLGCHHGGRVARQGGLVRVHHFYTGTFRGSVGNLILTLVKPVVL